MAIKMDQQCTRCHRTETVAVSGFQEAAALEEALKKKVAGAERLKTLITELTKNGQMPDLVAITGSQVVIHSYLCDRDEDKRSCAKRVADLVESLDALDERKPRKDRKPKAEAPAK